MKAWAPTSRLVGPKIVRTPCCSARLTPKVASSVSRGRPYRKRMMNRSISTPTRPATRNAHGMLIASDQPNRDGALVRISSCTR